jgi:hypothetical protein
MPIPQFPHCDQNVLHKPGDCKYCDMHPEWQDLRVAWGINFTGEKDEKKSPCPSERLRPAHLVHRWGGNRPTNVPVDTTSPTAWSRLREGEDEIPES